MSLLGPANRAFERTPLIADPATPFFFHKGFARVSPGFAAGVLALSAALCAPLSHARIAANANSTSTAAGDPTAAVRRQAASGQFARAEEQRVALNSKPSDKRTLADYKQVVNSYRHVYLITPHAAEVPDALLAVAELYTEMGDRFGRSYYQSAVDSYQFLMREYPKSKYCQDAYLRSAKLQKDQLGDTDGAIKTYEAFLKKFPRSPHRREAQEARAELALLQNSTPAESSKSAIAKSTEAEDRATVVESRPLPKESSRPAERETETASTRSNEESDASPAAKSDRRVSQIRKISTKAAADSTRVTIDLGADPGGNVQYVSGRIANPDRIYFDLHAAKLALQLVHGKIKTDGEMVSAVRGAQNPA